MYERVNVNCARENSTGDWESGIHNFIFQKSRDPRENLDKIDIFVLQYKKIRPSGRDNHNSVLLNKNK